MSKSTLILFSNESKSDELAELVIPALEPDLNALPKHNLCIVDSTDPELDYKLANAAYHGLAVLLTYTERLPASTRRLVDILVERDFYFDAASGKECVRLGDDGESSELVVSPLFRLILHVGLPMSNTRLGPFNSNQIFRRMTLSSSASHFVVDFTPSEEFVANDLLASIMEIEKSGFANQINLADKILFEAEFNIFNRQVKCDWF